MRVFNDPFSFTINTGHYQRLVWAWEELSSIIDFMGGDEYTTIVPLVEGTERDLRSVVNNLSELAEATEKNRPQRITHQDEQGSAAANDGKQEEADVEDESATQKRPANSVLVAEGHLDRLGTIETQLVGLKGLLDEADKYAGVTSLLEPIICDLELLTGNMHLFEERQKGGAA